MPTFAPHRRAFVAAVFAAAMPWIGAGARADDAAGPTYGVVSIIGDQINVIQRRPQFGPRVDTNRRDEMPVADATFDRIAMAAAEETIKRMRPGVKVLQAAIRDKRLFALQEGLLTETADSRDLRAAMQGLLSTHGATHLVLVAKHRSQASFQLAQGTTGYGFLEGIGFYHDVTTHLRYSESNQTSPGFVAPYAYLSVSLLDAAGLRTLKSATATESTLSLSIDSKDAVKAWDTLTAQQKMEALEGVIRSGVQRATAAALAE